MRNSIIKFFLPLFIVKRFCLIAKFDNLEGKMFGINNNEKSKKKYLIISIDDAKSYRKLLLRN